MKCLDCGSEMTNYDVKTKQSEISYDTCEKCGGLWLDAGELDKMAFQVDGDIEYCSEEKDSQPDQKMLKCPRCDGSVLARVLFLGYPDIILHACQNCGGFWLEGGELNAIDAKLKKIMPVRGRGFSDFVTNVHVPYWNKRIKRDSAEVDVHYEAPPIKGASRENPTSDICPNCGEELSVYRIFSMPFEGCPKCKGMWLVQDELRKLKDKVGHGSLRWMNDEIEALEKTSAVKADRPCVRCRDVRMASVLFGKSSLLIDWCPECHGIWLGQGEFQAIIDYLKGEEAGMKPKEIKAEALAEIKRLWGGNESKIEELRDAHAALSALISATIFEHPALFDFLQSFAFLP